MPNDGGRTGNAAANTAADGLIVVFALRYLNILLVDRIKNVIPNRYILFCTIIILYIHTHCVID